MRICVDTSVLIDYLRLGEEKDSFYKKIRENELHISLITVAELYSGKSVRGLAGRHLIDRLLQGIDIHLPTLGEAKKAGSLRNKYPGLSLADAFVAALAINEILQLATLDKKDFEMIKEISFVS